jgi:hypothetical protein
MLVGPGIPTCISLRFSVLCFSFTEEGRRELREREKENENQ